MNQQHPKIQHLVSRVVLRQFGNVAGKVGRLDLDTRETDSDIPENLGAIENLLGDEAAKTEEYWSKHVEGRMSPNVFHAIRSGTSISDPKITETLRRLMVLHFARGHAVHQFMQASQPVYATQAADAILKEASPQSVMRHFTGVEVPSPVADKLARDRLVEEFGKQVEETGFRGELFRRMFNKGLEVVDELAIQTIHSPHHQFLLGDSPALNYNSDNTELLGPLQGVRLGDADRFFMPVGPHHAIALSQKPEAIEITARQAEELNVFQARAASREVYFHTESGLGQRIAEALRREQCEEAVSRSTSNVR